MRLETEIRPLDLAITLGCGQTFRWEQSEPGVWRGTIRRHVLRLSQSTPSLFIETDSKNRDIVHEVREFLRADDDIALIQKRLRRDEILSRGMRDYRGLRIVKMDKWECLVSFALATYANIPRIKRMIETLSERYGEAVPRGHAFPSMRRLAQASVKDLEECGLGYRSRYVAEICQTLSPRELDAMCRLDYKDLRSALLELPGVGNKVADCVCLFGFGKLEAFPIDVWMERALARLYRVRGSYKQLSEFAVDRFGEYAGYAQEYLYFNERAASKTGACAFSEER